MRDSGREVGLHFFRAINFCPMSWPGWAMLSQVLPEDFMRINAQNIKARVVRGIFLSQAGWQHVSTEERFGWLFKPRWPKFRNLVLTLVVIVAVVFMFNRVRSQLNSPKRVPEYALPKSVNNGKSYASDPLPIEIVNLIAQKDVAGLEEYLGTLDNKLIRNVPYQAWLRSGRRGAVPPSAIFDLMNQSHVKAAIKKIRNLADLSGGDSTNGTER
jgi:hypothetical protein